MATMTKQLLTRLLMALALLSICLVMAAIGLHILNSRKYDAEKILASFSATAGDEMALDKLTQRLVAVVDETLQPAQVSAWLTPVLSMPRTDWKMAQQIEQGEMV